VRHLIGDKEDEETRVEETQEKREAEKGRIKIERKAEEI
jgi:hypothetical protein